MRRSGGTSTRRSGSSSPLSGSPSPLPLPAPPPRSRRLRAPAASSGSNTDGLMSPTSRTLQNKRDRLITELAEAESNLAKRRRRAAGSAAAAAARPPPAAAPLTNMDVGSNPFRPQGYGVGDGGAPHVSSLSGFTARRPWAGAAGATSEGSGSPDSHAYRAAALDDLHGALRRQLWASKEVLDKHQALENANDAGRSRTEKNADRQVRCRPWT